MIFPQLAAFTDVALLLLRIMVGVVILTSGWNHLKNPEARSRDIGMSKGLHDFSGHSRDRGKSGSHLWRSRATRCCRFDLDHARRDPEEDFYLAHRLLGRIRNKWMEL